MRRRRPGSASTRLGSPGGCVSCDLQRQALYQVVMVARRIRRQSLRLARTRAAECAREDADWPRLAGVERPAEAAPRKWPQLALEPRRAPALARVGRDVHGGDAGAGVPGPA